MEKIIKELKLARGILIMNNKILLAQDIRPGQGHYFLPGGNVEPGEQIKATLPREWSEELGWSIEVGNFIGCLEHTWNYKRKQDGAVIDVYEVNYLFSIVLAPGTFQKEPISKELHLKFSWVPIQELNSLNLLPPPLKNIIPEIINIKPSGIWVTTL